MSKTRSIHHIVFATKHRQPTISPNHKKELYAYILGICKNKQCHLLRINGMPDHIHMLVDIHPSISLSDLVKTIKQSTNKWLVESPLFPMFDFWARGYYAFSISPDEIDACRQYIINQDVHHSSATLVDEARALALKNGVPWHEADWD